MTQFSSVRQRRLAESRWGGPWVALAALLALAAALRLPGLRYGLPFPLLNPDEASIVPRGWELVHGGGLDPGWYDYPSLLLELLAPLQAFSPAPSYGAARVVAAAIGLASVAAAWWLGRAAYGSVAGAVAGAACAVASVHVIYSHMAVTDVLLTTLVSVSLALLVSGRLEWAGLAAGLAVSAKYPGVFLAAPLLAVGWRQWRRLAVAGGLAIAGFAATSPFVVWHAGAAWGDISRVQRDGHEGWLGFEHDHATPIAFLDRLWESLGPALLIGLAGLALALGNLVFQKHKLRSQRGDSVQSSQTARAGETLVFQEHKVASLRADLALTTFALVYFADLLTLNAHFDRYVLPLVPVVATLAGRLRALAPVTLMLLVVPLVWSAREVRELTRTDTRLVAHAWIERNVPSGARVAAESSTPPVSPRPVVRLELPGPGREADPKRDVDRLRRLGVDYVLVTGAVADRVLAAAAEYPQETRFYHELETSARRVLRVVPGHGLAGPWVALYRL